MGFASGYPFRILPASFVLKRAVRSHQHTTVIRGGSKGESYRVMDVNDRSYG